ncbi:DUF4229 domain-containing protein [Allonocardiopsis opalescens]|uniref:Uncharacterized protein DUF4229 n=1 Tax=Allonocardiopsis opalescens TaxID=1144618 RepID=A0A2T0Q7W1_9ACTN|nr:DUF4229 domain-containing protein [Allonocardiopsis opalescens]PRX99909.1 uncharacterized protein DUF4229 [Allonocardiopsis opalescens]
MRSFLMYTAARALLFALTFGVLYLLGARGVLAIGLALLISMPISYVLLSNLRDRLSAALVDGTGRLRGGLAAGAAAEDAPAPARPERPAAPAEGGPAAAG